MRAIQVQWALNIAAAVCIVVGLSIPLWTKNGVGISGFEGEYLSVGRWVLLATVLGSFVIMSISSLRKPNWMGILGTIAVVQSSLIAWKGYKLGAIGPGTWLLFLGAALLLVLAFLLRNSPKG